MTDDTGPASTGDATVLGTSVERPAAEAAAELNEGVRARPAADDTAPAPRAEPSRRRGLPFIPRTGADAALLAVTGGALVATGFALTRAARRRRSD